VGNITENQKALGDDPLNRENQIVDEKKPSRFSKILYLIAGFIFLIIGIIGIILPILPTTPFLLLSAGCFARSSEKFYNWLISNKILGAYIRNYREGTGMPLKIKIFTISMLWLTILLSIFFLITIYWVKILLFIIAIAVTLHIALIRPKEKEGKEKSV